MTKTERRIALAYLKFYEKQFIKEHEYSFPSIKIIAEIANCSERTVNTFIKKYEIFVFDHENRWDKETKKQLSNLYHYNYLFFETLILLKFNNLLHNLEKIGKDLILKVSENDDFLCEKTVKKINVMNSKLRTGNIVKLRTIESYLKKSYLYIVLKKDVPPKNTKEEEKIFQELNATELTFSQKNNLRNTFSIVSIKKAVQDYVYVKNTQGIYNPWGFMFSKCKKHMSDQCQFFNRRY